MQIFEANFFTRQICPFLSGDDMGRLRPTCKIARGLIPLEWTVLTRVVYFEQDYDEYYTCNRGHRSQKPIVATQVAKYPNLRKLEIQNLGENEKDTVRILFPSAESSLILNLSLFRIHMYPLGNVIFTRLETLQLDGCFWPEYEGPHLPSLKKLTLTNPVDEVFRGFFSHMPAIREINLKLCVLEDLPAIASLESLTILESQGTWPDTMLSTCPNLRELKIVHCQNLVLKQQPSLEHADFEDSRVVVCLNDEELGNYVSHARLISIVLPFSHLDIGPCPQLEIKF